MKQQKKMEQVNEGVLAQDENKVIEWVNGTYAVLKKLNLEELKCPDTPETREIFSNVGKAADDIAEWFDNELRYAGAEEGDEYAVNLSVAIETKCGYSHDDIDNAGLVGDDLADTIRYKMAYPGWIYQGTRYNPFFDTMMVFVKA